MIWRLSRILPCHALTDSLIWNPFVDQLAVWVTNLGNFYVTLSTCIRYFSLGRHHTRLEGIVLRSLMHSDVTTTHWWTWDPTLPSGHSCTRTPQPLIDELEILHDVRTHLPSLVLDADITLYILLSYKICTWYLCNTLILGLDIDITFQIPRHSYSYLIPTLHFNSPA